METVVKRLEDLEAQMSIYVEDITRHRIKIKMLEIKLCESEANVQKLENQLKTVPGSEVISKIQELETRLFKSEANVQKLENQLKTVPGTEVISKIKELETKLFESEANVQKLENQLKTAPGTNVTSHDGEKAKTSQEFSTQIVNLQQEQPQQVQGFNFYHNSLNRAFGDLKMNARETSSKVDELTGLYKSLQEKLEDFQSSWTKNDLQAQGGEEGFDLVTDKTHLLHLDDYITKKKRKAKATTSVLPVEISDEDMEEKFASHMHLVRDHRLPLTGEDYCNLSALEAVAGITDGPAFKALTRHWDGNLNKAEIRCQAQVAMFRDKAVIRRTEAIEEYLKHGNGPPDNTPRHAHFYLVNTRDNKSYILSVDQTHIRLLDDSNPKMEKVSWKLKSVQSCGMNANGQIELAFAKGKTLGLDTWERINQEVRVQIINLM